MSLSLELVTKVAVFENVRREGMMPQAPIVGERWIVCRADRRLMAVLDRKSLEVVHRYDDPEVLPVAWLGPDRLLMGGPRTVGVWDIAEQRLVWRDDRRGAFPWRDSVVTWASDTEFEIRRATGEIERAHDLGTRGRGYGAPCGDLFVFSTPDNQLHTCDPIRAVQLVDGEVRWTRNMLAEINARRPSDDPYPPAIFTPTSTPDRCIVTRDRSMAACSLSDGAILWTVDVLVPYHWPLVEEGRIPVLCGDRFTVTDEATGEMLVDRRHSELNGIFRERRGSIVGGLVVFGSESTHLAAFDLGTGDLVFVKKHKTVGFWGSAVADGRLLAAGTDGKLWVYKAA